MPSLVEKMQPWTQTHSFIPTNLLRRSWSTSSATSNTPLTTSASANSLHSSGGNSNSGGSEILLNDAGGSKSNAKSTSARGGSGSGNGPSIFERFCSGSGSKNGSNNGSISANSGSSSNSSSSKAGAVCNGSRPKRKTPILSTCMSNWVKFDHDCQKPSHCAECDKNQERKRNVLFTSGGNMLISTGNSVKGKHHHHRHSHSFFGGGSSHSHNRHSHVNGLSTEPSSPTDCVVVGNGTVVSDSSETFPQELVNWENAKNKSKPSFKIVINVPCLDMNLFQNENVQVQIVCNKSKLTTGKDFAIVQRTRQELKSSGWYWEGIDSEKSMEILESTHPGAFIVRDSSDPRFLYSLSIQTDRGPTSVRLPYRNGKFSLDGDEKIADRVPKFDSVIGLIEHYVNGGTRIGKKVSVWIDHEGNMHSTVKLIKPIKKNVGSLKHLARVAINKHNLLINNNNNNNNNSRSNSDTPLAESVPTPVASTSSANCQKVNGVTSSNGHTSSCTTPSVDNFSRHNSTSLINPIPIGENGISSSSPSSSTSLPVVDLSKLPTSLQSYMLEYPYKL